LLGRIAALDLLISGIEPGISGYADSGLRIIRPLQTVERHRQRAARNAAHARLGKRRRRQPLEPARKQALRRRSVGRRRRRRRRELLAQLLLELLFQLFLDLRLDLGLELLPQLLAQLLLELRLEL